MLDLRRIASSKIRQNDRFATKLIQITRNGIKPMMDSVASSKQARSCSLKSADEINKFDSDYCK